MRSLDRLSGLLIAGGPLLVLVALRLDAPTPPLGRSTELVPIVLAVLAGVMTSLTGVLLAARRRAARVVVALGAAAFAAAVLHPAVSTPAVALATLSGVAVVVYAIAAVLSSGSGRVAAADGGRGRAVTRVRAASVIGLAGVLAVAISGAPRQLELLLIAASLGATWLLVLQAVSSRELVTSRPRRLLLAGTALAAVVTVAVTWGNWWNLIGSLALVPLAALTLSRQPGLPSALIQALVDAVLSHPARLLAVTFALLSALGALMLKLPFAGAPGKVIAGIDAVFTATSAVCVTGLIVLDTPQDFSTGGHVILLVLIQLGGLGIMSFSTAAVAFLGQRLSLRHEAAVADLFAGHRGEMFVAVRRLLLFTFGAEAAGALLLWPQLTASGVPSGTALWQATFTSISAFCNAGFALNSDSLVSYDTMPGVLHVVGALIVLGGLSPAVIATLPRWARGKTLDLQARLVLGMTVGLLASGALIVGALEWSNTLGALSVPDRVHNAWFQSLTLRTAGFNSVDFAALRPATVWVMTAFMFIGGSPGGTAGGIKTTTVAVLFLAVGSAMRGRWEIVAGGRRIANATLYKAAALTTFAVATVVVAVIAIEVTQPLSIDLALFEVVSALATVGLSLGATSTLDDVGKAIITVCMFLGRIGPLTLFLFLREQRSEAPWVLPERELDVG